MLVSSHDERDGPATALGVGPRRRRDRIALIVTGAALFVFRSARSLPAEMAESGRKALSDLREVAAAFRTGSITTTFHGDATSVAGTTRLQFAELRQEEVFERRDAAAVLWGALALPDVVVEARVPVAYTYFLDLDKEWRFQLEEGVVARDRAARWNGTGPAPDVSALRFSVREGSVLRDEQLVLDRPAGRAHAAARPARARPRAARPRDRAPQGRGVRRDVARAALRRREAVPRARGVRRRSAAALAAGPGAALAAGLGRAT